MVVYLSISEKRIIKKRQNRDCEPKKIVFKSNAQNVNKF